MGGSDAGPLERVTDRIVNAFPNLLEVVLDPSGLGEMLRKFVIGAR